MSLSSGDRAHADEATRDQTPEPQQQPFASVENVRLRKFLQSHITPDSQRFLCLLGFVVIVQESPGGWARVCGLWAAGWLLASRHGLTRRWVERARAKLTGRQ